MRIDRFKLICELERRDCTQKRLSEMSGISRTTINAVCKGRTCSDTVAEKLADALDLDVSELEEVAK